MLVYDAAGDEHVYHRPSHAPTSLSCSVPADGPSDIRLSCPVLDTTSRFKIQDSRFTRFQAPTTSRNPLSPARNPCSHSQPKGHLFESATCASRMRFRTQRSMAPRMSAPMTLFSSTGSGPGPGCCHCDGGCGEVWPGPWPKPRLAAGTDEGTTPDNRAAKNSRASFHPM